MNLKDGKKRATISSDHITAELEQKRKQKIHHLYNNNNNNVDNKIKIQIIVWIS
jgi:hypothetical protein